MKMNQNDIKEERPVVQPSHGTNPGGQGKRQVHQNNVGTSILDSKAIAVAARRKKQAIRVTPLGGRGGSLDVGLTKQALKGVWATMQEDLKAED